MRRETSAPCGNAYAISVYPSVVSLLLLDELIQLAPLFFSLVHIHLIAHVYLLERHASARRRIVDRHLVRSRQLLRLSLLDRCRKAKIKCNGKRKDAQNCSRCEAKGLECNWTASRRGKKPGTKK
ncbi:hypothetical protein PHSY_003091 [Pseudozyma hubeiensis SY62]|uniref:Zn(2)-C6 fungal-type domain-containing protein n=1 Tax=Pseudozyma hubeiensis (strain SY62) TaxID=1305764 RepID=R9PBQ7_PSEHS|nr:hypothetical protein PHSY_003091 [Pseudozyma hubeiensis SY62]GAC95515.1 hypothetical protein PHSY_003091 [Pseudozyma hubeiensis SY62]